MNKSLKFTFALLIVGTLAALGVYFANGGHGNGETAAGPAHTAGGKLRLGVIPERDIYAQHRAYQALANYLGTAGIETSLVTASSYAGALEDFHQGQVDAFMAGSLIAVLAVDRYGGEVVLRTEGLGGNSTYSGVLFVRADSPARRLADLSGRRVGAVRTTMAGAIYPLYLMQTRQWNGDHEPVLVWSGTHDDVIAEVVAGRLDAGSVKDTRLAAYVRAHPEVQLRRLAESGRVPDNALVVQQRMAAGQKEKLIRLLAGMDKDPQAAAVLGAMEVRRFVACRIAEYGELYDMIEELARGRDDRGGRWDSLELGPAPRRPADMGPSTVKGGR